MMHYIEFGGIKSSDYGIYISGEGVFNAPERDVEVIEIPGRDGAYVLDHGNYKNIQVTYPAFNQEGSMNDFISAIDDFRNAMASLTGYQRLSDSFHPDEYRMAALVDGIEVKPLLYNETTSKFSLVFNCKPQRYLISGESETTVTSGGSINNPTQFKSHPLLMVKGYGDINIGGNSFNIQNIVLGQVFLTARAGGTPQWSVQYPSGLLNNGDAITINQGSEAYISLTLQSGVISEATTTNNGSYASVRSSFSRSSINITVSFNELYFTAGTSSTITNPLVLSFDYRIGTSPEYTQTITFTPKLVYDSTNRKFTLSVEYTSLGVVTLKSRICTIEQAMGDSTISTLGNPSYIDCDIGEAYKITSGKAVSINNAVSLGGILPSLSPGSNTVTYSNTVTELKIKPRWWKI